MCAAASCRHRQALAPRPLGGSHRQQLYQARPPAADTASTARARVVVCVCVARAATVTEARRCYPSSHSSTVCPLNRWPLRAAFSAASARACDAMNSLCPRARGGGLFAKSSSAFVRRSLKRCACRAAASRSSIVVYLPSFCSLVGRAMRPSRAMIRV